MRIRGAVTGLVIAASACGSGPDIEDFEGTWRLTQVNDQALPVLGTATGGEVWVAAILELGTETGSLDRCMRDPSTSTEISRNSALVISSADGERVTLQYFDRRSAVPDTATIRDGDELTLHFQNLLAGQQELDVLTFVPLTGDIPEDACDLAP